MSLFRDRPHLAATIVVVSACLGALGSMQLGETAARSAARERAEQLAAIVDRGAGPLRPEDEGLWVRVAGPSPDPAAVEDRDTGVRITASFVRRTVEMWQGQGVRDGDGRSWRYETRWSERPILVYLGDVSRLAERANPPQPFASEDLSPPVARVGEASIDPDLMRRLYSWIDRQPVPPQELVDAVARRFPERRVTADGEWTVVAQGGERAVGDLRIRYAITGWSGTATAFGQQRGGRLQDTSHPLAPSGVWRRDIPLAELVRPETTDAFDQPNFWGRAVGVVLLALGVAFLVFRPDRKRGERHDDGAGEVASSALGLVAALAALSDTLGAIVGIVFLLLLVPFAVASAPLAWLLAILAGWMAERPANLALGWSVAAGLSAAALAWAAWPAGAPSQPSAPAR